MAVDRQKMESHVYILYALYMQVVGCLITRSRVGYVYLINERRRYKQDYIDNEITILWVYYKLYHALP
jgi:hypothetical protein